MLQLLDQSILPTPPPKKKMSNCCCLTVMSYPAEGVESAYRNHIDDVRAFLDSRHSESYAVYNCSQRSYKTVKFQNRVCAISSLFGIQLCAPKTETHVLNYLRSSFSFYSGIGVWLACQESAEPSSVVLYM